MLRFPNTCYRFNALASGTSALDDIKILKECLYVIKTKTPLQNGDLCPTRGPVWHFFRRCQNAAARWIGLSSKMGTATSCGIADLH